MNSLSRGFASLRKVKVTKSIHDVTRVPPHACENAVVATLTLFPLTSYVWEHRTPSPSDCCALRVHIRVSRSKV